MVFDKLELLFLRDKEQAIIYEEWRLSFVLA